MTYLSCLSPAETIMLIDPDNANGLEMFKLTFIDLLIKKRLRMYLHPKVNKKDKRLKYYKYISLGLNYNINIVRPHEAFFFNSLPSKNSRNLIRQYISDILKNVNGEEYFKTKTIESNYLKDCFSQNLFQKLYNGFSISDKGIELGLIIKKEIEDLEKIFPTLLKKNQKKVIDIIHRIGANVLLLKGLDISVLNFIGKDFNFELNKKNGENKMNGLDLNLDFFDFFDFGKDIEIFELGGGSFGGAGAGGSWDDVLDGLDILSD